MTDERLDGAGDDELIAAFFGALSLRELERCAALLGALRGRPGRAAWCAYLEGVLANERDNDWSRAEAIFRGLLAGELEPPLRGRALLALGRTYDYQGRWAEAIAAYEESLPLFAALGRPADQARAWKQIAIAYHRGFSQGDYGPAALGRAGDYCRLALATLGPDDDEWLVGTIWNTLGAISMSLGRWDEAERSYEHDLAICRALDDRHGVGVSLLNLGEIAHRRGAWEAAEGHYRQALALLRAFDDRHLEADALANLAALAQDRGGLDAALEHYAAAIDVVESLRAGLSSEQARAGFFATAADIYANAVICCVEAGRPGLAFDYVERARARAFLDSLAGGDAGLPEPPAAPIGLAEAQAALADDELLLSYFTTGLVEAGAGRDADLPALRHRFPPARTMLFAVSRRDIALFPLAVSPNDLLPPVLNSVVERHFLLPQIRRALYERLLAPAAGLLAGRRRIYLAPHGPLHYIPFHALLAPDGETLLRHGAPELAYGPSATVILRRRAAPPAPAPAPMLAAGANGDGPSRLSFAEEEASSLASLLGGRSLVGAALSAAALFAEAPACRYLHISSHGLFDPESPLESALILGPAERLTARDIMAGLRLRCRLVSLSACESGLSRVRRGDELVGLMRAFLSAGASAVLCTLWRVDERSTRIFMERFYRRVLGGAGFAAALQGAQLDLRSISRRAARELLAGSLARELLAVSMSGYLKGEPGGEGQPVSLLDGPDDEAPFAAPIYWAPFILVGLSEAM